MTSEFRVTLKRLAPLTAAAFLLASGAHAQPAAPESGIPSSTLRSPGASAPSGSSIPSDAIDLGSRSLSSAATFSTLDLSIPGNPALGAGDGSVSAFADGFSPSFAPHPHE